MYCFITSVLNTTFYLTENRKLFNSENQQQLYYITAVGIAQSRCCCVWRECCWLPPLSWACCCGPDSDVVADWRAGGAVATAKWLKVTRRQQQSWAQRPVLLEGRCCCLRTGARVTWRHLGVAQGRAPGLTSARTLALAPSLLGAAHSTFYILLVPVIIAHITHGDSRMVREKVQHIKFMPHICHVWKLGDFI